MLKAENRAQKHNIEIIMDWVENDLTGYLVALGDNNLSYWVGDDGLAGAPVFARAVDGIYEIMIYRGPKGSEDAAKLWAEKHSKRVYQ